MLTMRTSLTSTTSRKRLALACRLKLPHTSDRYFSVLADGRTNYWTNNSPGSLSYSQTVPKTPQRKQSFSHLPPRPPASAVKEPSFKVAVVSYTGTVEVINLKTSELLKTANIYARDLIPLNLTSRQERYVRSSSSGFHVRRTLSVIFPRSKSMVLSFGSVRAVAGLRHVMLLDAHNPFVQDFAYELASLYKSQQENTNGSASTEAGELVFLEQVLRETIESYNRRLRLYDPIVDSFLDKVASEVYSDTGVHQLVPLKDSLQSFEIQVKQSLECLTSLLNNDDDMLALLLTEQEAAEQAGGNVDFARHEHVELLLGVYARQLSNILLEINYFLGRVQSKQEFVALALSGYRNRMIRMNVHLAIAGLSLGLATSIAGFFGMNLINGFEQSPYAFDLVLVGSGIGGIVIAGSSLNYLSGQTMRKRAAQRLEEIETLTSALSDMCALDYAVKSTLERNIIIDKEQFRQILKRARQSHKASQSEVDFLFDVFDRIKDGHLTSEDFADVTLQKGRVDQ